MLDEFFSHDPKKLTYYCSLEKQLDDVSQQMARIQQQGIYQVVDQRRHDQFREELVKHAAVCRRQARETYFSERLHLLKCLQIVFNEAVNNGPYRSHFDDHLTSKLIRDKNLPRNLLEGLLRNLEWEKEFKSDEQVSYDAYREELTPA